MRHGTSNTASRAALLVAIGFGVLGGPVFGQANDNWATRTPIAALPFNVNETLAWQATTEPTDPAVGCPSASSNPLSNTLWYGYTAGASVGYLTLAIGGSLSGHISVVTGTPGAFRRVTGGCTGAGSPFPDTTQIVGLRLMPGQVVSIIIGSHFSLSPGEPIAFSVAASTR